MKSNTDWLVAARWGVLLSYLDEPASGMEVSKTTAEEWNRRVDSFDVQALARQLQSVGAGYLCITLGQNSGFYCSPNATYDGFVGHAPSKCSRRDLIADLAAALRPTGIRLLVYLPSGAPATDEVAMEKLGWERSSTKRLAEFQQKWEAVIREWSTRWGDKVSGWWIDGCYFADAMYRGDDAPNFASFAAALKAGNPNSIIAFCPGPVRGEVDDKRNLVSPTGDEDFLAGEVDDIFPICKGRWLGARGGGRVQWHVLSYLGSWWGQGEPRFRDDFVIGYTKGANDHEGVVTWDVPVSNSGVIPQNFLDQLARLK